MVTDLIANIRKELTKIKSFKINRVGKMTAESLKSFPGFEKMSIELRQQFLDTMRELCRIALLHISNGKKNEQVTRSICSFNSKSAASSKKK
jgi:hypothetical protein